MLDNAFEALKTYDWGTDMAVLNPIEDAVASSYGKPAEREELEKRLVAALSGPLTRDAQDYLCRKLTVAGSDACVPVLKSLLLNKGTSHMARFALERMPSTEAGKALRDSIAAAEGDVKVGLIGSVGSRRDAEAVPALTQLMTDASPDVARAAILALGAIGTAAAAAALKADLKLSSGLQAFVNDALLSCAEKLLTGNQRDEAHAIYQKFSQSDQPRYLRLAATRGLLACASKSA